VSVGSVTKKMMISVCRFSPSLSYKRNYFLCHQRNNPRRAKERIKAGESIRTANLFSQFSLPALTYTIVARTSPPATPIERLKGHLCKAHQQINEPEREYRNQPKRKQIEGPSLSIPSFTVFSLSPTFPVPSLSE